MDWFSGESRPAAAFGNPGAPSFSGCVREDQQLFTSTEFGCLVWRETMWVPEVNLGRLIRTQGDLAGSGTMG